jgi:hypothetical protein
VPIKTSDKMYYASFCYTLTCELREKNCKKMSSMCPNMCGTADNLQGVVVERHRVTIA